MCLDKLLWHDWLFLCAIGSGILQSWQLRIMWCCVFHLPDVLFHHVHYVAVIVSPIGIRSPQTRCYEWSVTFRFRFSKIFHMRCTFSRYLEHTWSNVLEVLWVEHRLTLTLSITYVCIVPPYLSFYSLLNIYSLLILIAYKLYLL